MWCEGKGPLIQGKPLRTEIRLFAEDAGRIAVADADITAARDTRSRFSGNGP